MECGGPVTNRARLETFQRGAAQSNGKPCNYNIAQAVTTAAPFQERTATMSMTVLLMTGYYVIQRRDRDLMERDG